ncbi:NACHT domain-containing protein [Cupriavidus sp. YR651]|uniref:NACHT domain-containing protein n=1 Tax=Cupriavidus sp. YR651 TaxID=1855315 RepID=UPI00088F4322|nr:NACHT domain-containing protein [Cupriavidus sp. YR651]SDC62473.1 NACHT domain-containing protein [Cupriavidus sp. YR651]
MSDSLLVRASRDGDQFHYLWAARRALSLLNPLSGLVAITIEGASTDETGTSAPVETGEELIDIAEYYGDTDMSKASLVRYMQLKHSTLHAEDEWKPSGIEKTISGFAKRYGQLQTVLGAENVGGKLEFWFVTNRPIHADFAAAVKDVASSGTTSDTTNLEKLEKYTGLREDKLAEFCRLLRLEGLEDNYWTQRNILSQDLNVYLPQLDADAPIRLKELITRKALSESANEPSVTKIDVLRALQTDEPSLFPARCLIESVPDAVTRAQEHGLVKAIVAAGAIPVVISADGGVGKSVFSTQIARGLPEGSVAILYDCFGNGEYRSLSGYRHRHRTALVQMANELAGKGLCHPLIPSPQADTTSYACAFLHRLRQAVRIVRADHADALVCIIVDAADNAQMAAEEAGEARSFIRDLLRETLPDGVRLVALCRPYREAMLDPPPHALRFALEAFSQDETAAHLRKHFPSATDQDVSEFHRLSSHNPRVQALALSHGGTLPDILRLLGPNPSTVESTIGEILEQAVQKLRDEAGVTAREQVDMICAGLAALRPRVPISILASMSGVDAAAIKSFALDLGRPLVVAGESVQFFDEPAESWFRMRFRPSAATLEAFLEKLKPLASESAYAASVLPALMLEAGQFAELVRLALDSEALPDANLLERRDIELQRLQFALKAGLRNRDYVAAAKLAMKGGGEKAGDVRQRELLQSNIDLAGSMLDVDAVQELVTRRAFEADWKGSHHAYEAALLSAHAELIGEAGSRLRMANEWLKNWNSLPRNERENESVTNEDRAVLALANLNIHGPQAASDFLGRWRPRSYAYEAGRILAKRLLDHGRCADVDALGNAASNNLGLLLAIVQESRALHLLPPVDISRCALEGVKSHLEKTPDERELNIELLAVVAVVEAAHLQKLCEAEEAAKILDVSLPSVAPRIVLSPHASERFDYTRAYALRAALRGESVTLKDVAPEELRKEIEKQKSHGASGELREFEASIGAVLPWANVWAAVVCGRLQAHQIASAIAEARNASHRAESATYRERSLIADEVASLWIDVLMESGTATTDTVRELVAWSHNLNRPLYTPTLNRLARLCAKTDGIEEFAFEFAQTSIDLVRRDRSDAGSEADGYVSVARSLLALSHADAALYFDKAIEVANKIGEENVARWHAILALAEHAAQTEKASPEMTYRFARCAELTWRYVLRDKHFPWEATVEVLTKLDPQSSFAIISRWRDRAFGNPARVLAVAVESLAASGRLLPGDALAMIPFDASWDEDALLASALPRFGSDAERIAGLSLVYRYLCLGSHGASKWQRVRDTAATVGVSLPGIEQRIAEATARETSKQNRVPGPAVPGSSEEVSGHDWEAVFAGLDVASAAELTVAYQRFREGEPPFRSTEFFRAAFARVKFGREVEFVQAVERCDWFDLFELRDFLSEWPSRWIPREVIRAALASMVARMCKKFCLRIERNRYYEVMPFQLASERSGLGIQEMVDAVFQGLAELPDALEGDRLFSLVALLAPKMTGPESVAVLSYAIAFLEIHLESEDGDGAWSYDLEAPDDIHKAVAGYIWAGLASPVAEVRWQSAHVVVALCTLGADKTLAAVVDYANGAPARAFHDGKLLFYSLHARQWLLIGLARASLEYGKSVASHADFVLSLADPSQSHVFMRGIAARTALALDEQHLIVLSEQRRDELRNINVSKLPEVEGDAFAAKSARREVASLSEPVVSRDNEFFFGIDFGPYWLAALGRCFGMTQGDVEEEVLTAIRKDVGYSGPSRWDADERTKKKIYQHDETHHSHGAYPKVDDQTFYFSYHAMMIAAGVLLASRPLVIDEWERSRFVEWLSGHGLSRCDGRWLADRRDPEPRSLLTTRVSPDWETWRNSVSADEFTDALAANPGYITVWGSWSDEEGNMRQTTLVYSALVCSSRSSSLLRALQSIDDPHDFRIPSAGDERAEIDAGAFQLRGWIKDDHNDSGLDESDFWAGTTRFPAPEPAAFVVEKFGLRTDSDRRHWHVPEAVVAAFRSQVWGMRAERRSSEPPSGRKLEVSSEFISELLTAVDMDLIIEVQVEKTNPSRFRNGDSDEPARIPSSSRIFVVKADGTIDTL